MEVKNFEDIEIWKDARLLAKAIYQMTKDTGFAKDFALRDQIRRAAMSVMSNIAEGFERGGNQLKRSALKGPQYTALNKSKSATP